MRQISTKGGTRWRCIESIKAIKKTAAERDAFGKKVSTQNAQALSDKLKNISNKSPT
jgi:uridylate kinase